MNITIGFIGGGQMAEALLKGLLDKGICTKDQLCASDPSDIRREHLSRQYGIRVLEANTPVMESSEVVILAVKPQIMKVVLDDIAASVNKAHLIVSIAAGISTAFLEKALPDYARVIRVMPNTPALVQKGAAALCKGSRATDEDLDKALSIFGAVGEAVEVPESLMDAVTGLSGSGPAYVFTFIQALVDGGVLEGLPRDVAQMLAVQTVLGAAEMCKKSRKNPAELTAMVTSPGGTTIQGLYEMERDGFRGTVMAAVSAATARSKELGGN